MRPYLIKLKEPFLIIRGECFQSLMWALFLPAIFFSSFLLAPSPQYNFFGDLYNLYFPQFVEGYHLAKSGTFTGVDFLTNNGASAYFLRPNIPVFYPVYQLFYLLFSFETIEGFARAYVIILYVHSVLAVYFAMRIGQSFLHMDIATALLLGVLYFGAVANSYAIPPFYFVASLFPLLLYSAMRSIEEKIWWRLVLYSFPFLMVFLSGYLPLDVYAVSLALIFALAFFSQNSGEDEWKNFLQAAKLLVPVGLASLVALPIYLAVLQYNKLVLSLPDGVWYSAHELSYQAKDIFALISRSFIGSVPPGGEFPSILLGLTPVLLLLIAFTHRKKLSLTLLEARVIGISILIFTFFLILAFGRSSGLPDLFYYLVPGIGKMHIYGRFLPIAAFFFYMTTAIAFKHLVEVRKDLPLGRWIAGLLILLIVVYGYGQFGQPQSVSTNLLVIEFLMIGLVLIGLCSRQRIYAFVAAIAVPFFIHAANFNSYTNLFNLSFLPPYKNTVIFSEERRDSLRNYFKEHTNKKLIKYADITSSIEKLNGVMLNYPWMVQDTVRLSNYMGYELHTSVDRDYLARFPWFGKVNVSWLLRTGADYIIYDSAAWSVYAAELGPWINYDVPELDIGYGYKAAKLKDASGNTAYISATTLGDFDNGIVQVSNSSGTASVSGFETDFSSHVRFQVNSTLPVSIKYLLFPNKFMELLVNGKRSDLMLKDGLLEFSLPPGHHQIEYQYKNRLHQLFIIAYLLYIVLLLSIIGWRAWLMFRPILLKRKY